MECSEPSWKDRLSFQSKGINRLNQRMLCLRQRDAADAANAEREARDCRNESESVSTGWDLGNKHDPKVPICPEHLAEARRRFHLAKNTANQCLAQHHKTVDAQEGLLERMDSVIKEKKRICCQSLGICKHDHEAIHPLAFAHAIHMHSIFQQIVVTGSGLSKEELKGTSCLFCVHGRPSEAQLRGKPPDGLEDVYEIYIMLGWQLLKPRLTAFVKCLPVQLGEGSPNA